jgi:hypothetical protein
MRKLMCLSIVSLVLAFGTVGKAVTVELSSADANTIVHPGDTVPFTLTLVNDTNKPDIVRLNLMTFVNQKVITAGSFRILMRPNQVITRDMEFDIPAWLKLTSPDFIVVRAAAYGRLSNTYSEDQFRFAIAPAPAPTGTTAK